MTAVTTDGNRVGFYAHIAKKHGNKKKMNLMREKSQHQVSVAGSVYTNEEQTKSMKQYEKDLQFKNKVLQAKEKQVFNEKVLKRLSQH